jgi:hypothetical protein
VYPVANPAYQKCCVAPALQQDKPTLLASGHIQRIRYSRMNTDAMAKRISLEIIDDARQSSDSAKMRILELYEAGSIDFAVASRKLSELEVCDSYVPEAPQAAHRHQDNFSRLKRDWVTSKLVLAGVMPEPANRDLNEVYAMSLSLFGRKCIEQRDAGLIERARAQGTGLEDLLFQQTRDWTETGASQVASDFPLAVEDIFKKSASLGYADTSEPLTFLYNKRPVPNFLTHGMIQQVDVPPLVAVTENNAFTVADVGDYGEEAALATKGIIYSITRQTIVNNDTSSIALNAQKAGIAGKRAEAADIHALLTSSYLLKDGTELFAAARGNITAVGAAPDVAGADVVRAAMAAFTAPSGSTVNMYPAVLVCGRNQEGVAATLRNAQYMPMQEAITPGYTPGSFVVVADGRFADSSWFMLADPRIHSGIEKLYLAGGTGEPVIEFMNQFEYDGIQARVRHDYTIAAADWRSFYKVAVA